MAQTASSPQRSDESAIRENPTHGYRTKHCLLGAICAPMRWTVDVPKGTALSPHRMKTGLSARDLFRPVPTC
jgi:hypothetical protein